MEVKFIYTISVEPPAGEDEQENREEVERFARLMEIAISGACSDCGGLHAELELVTTLP